MKDSKNLVIGILCAVVCVMAVAYAAFTANLEVNGTATITGKWDVKFTSISCSTTGTAVQNAGTGVSATTGLTATVDFTLVAPGDSAYCDLTVTNAGNLPAIFKTISYGSTTAEELAESPIIITVSQPSVLTLAASGTSGNAHVWRVNASYDSSTTSLENATLSKTATITLNYQQNLG